MNADRLFFSADADYLAVATSELRALFPDAGFATISPDLAAIDAEGLAIAGLAEICRETPGRLRPTPDAWRRDSSRLQTPPVSRR